MKRSSALATLLGASSLSLYSTPTFGATGANDRLRIACIGSGGRGGYITSLASRYGEIAMICDVNLKRAEDFKGRVKAEKAEICQDYRRVLDNKDIDVIVQGAPDHWHTKINVEACRSGKDVYAEKPLTLTIEEGKLLRDVVRQTGRIVQVGTQQRSGAPFQTAIELIRAGRIGKIKSVHVSLPHYSTHGGPFPEEPVPETVDWDRFLGQAPVAPFSTQRLYTWRRWYEYSGGNVTDWGNHHTDILLWGLDAEHSGPVSVQADAYYPNEGKPLCFETADRFCSRMVFKDKDGNEIDVFFFEALGDHWEKLKQGESSPTFLELFDKVFGKDCPEEVKATKRNGLQFIGESGRIFVNRGGVFGKPVDQLKDDPLPENAWRAPNRDVEGKNEHEGTILHVKNFFDCVHSREQPVASVELEHRAVSVCHLTNISLWLEGQRIRWDPEKEQIVDNPKAARMQRREQREPYTIS